MSLSRAFVIAAYNRHDDVFWGITVGITSGEVWGGGGEGTHLRAKTSAGVGGRGSLCGRDRLGIRGIVKQWVILSPLVFSGRTTWSR